MDVLALRVAARFAAHQDLEWKVSRKGSTAKVELFVQGKLVGFLSIGTESVMFMKGPCKSNVEALLAEEFGGQKVKVYRVFQAELQPAYQGKGYGVEMYKRLLSEVAPAILTADKCHGGETSSDAARVWKSLSRIYRTLGTDPETWALAVK